jgi:hypothetical protein
MKKKVNIRDLNRYELIFLADDLICILECKACDDDEYETPDNLVNDNLKKAPLVLDLIG